MPQKYAFRRKELLHCYSYSKLLQLLVVVVVVVVVVTEIFE